MSDTMAKWLVELARPEPDVAIVAALEAQAANEGFDPPVVLEAMVARLSFRGRGGGFDADLHPRGKDGKFIEKLGLVQLLGDVRTPDGRKVNLAGRRGRVEGISPDPKTPGRPNIRVSVLDNNGKPGPSVNVKPDGLIQAPEKARLDTPIGAKKGLRDRFRRDDEAPEPRAEFAVSNRDLTDRDYLERGNVQRTRPPGYDTPPEMTPQRAAEDRARGMSDADLDRFAPTGDKTFRDAARAEQDRRAASKVRNLPDERLAADEGADTTGLSDVAATQKNAAWRAAIEAEQANRAKRRAEDDAKRQKLIDDVNTAAADLSTTDAQARAEGLDDILSKLRFSIIDTNRVHDEIYPPGESGRWSPERAAQHEEMWQELLANVEAAGVPKDHDAFVLGGLPGAGKSYSLRPGQKADKFGVRAWETNAPVFEGATHVSLNPDIVKEMLIDKNMLPEGLSDDLKPMEKVTFIHEESSYLAKLFSQRLGEEGYNVVLDNTFDSEGGMLKRMTPLAREGYTFRGLFVDIPIDESKASAKQRYIDKALTPEGGRFVPSSVQGNRQSSKGNLSKNRDAFDSMVSDDWFKEWSVIDNTGITNRTPLNEVTAEGSGDGSAAGAYLPNNDKNPVKQGPKLPTPAEAPPTIDVNAAPIV